MILVTIGLSPDDRITWPLLQWRMYRTPGPGPDWSATPVLVIEENEERRADTLFAPDLFTPVEFRMSERVIRGAFAEDQDPQEGFRKVIARRLDLPAGSVVLGYTFRWRIDKNAQILFDRREPDEVVELGSFEVSEGMSH